MCWYGAGVPREGYSVLLCRPPRVGLHPDGVRRHLCQALRCGGGMPVILHVHVYSVLLAYVQDVDTSLLCAACLCAGTVVGREFSVLVKSSNSGGKDCVPGSVGMLHPTPCSVHRGHTDASCGFRSQTEVASFQNLRHHRRVCLDYRRRI
jgi:hypothetical protein